MNYRTFFVCLILALPLQFDKLLKSSSLGLIEVSIAFLSACGLALFWAFIATWLRNRFAKDLSDSYITKVQLGFSVLGVALLISVFLNNKNIDIDTAATINTPTLIEDATIRAKAEKFHTQTCNEYPKNYSVKCEELGDVLFKCVSDLNNPRSKIAESIDLCISKIQIRN
jgi:hypothetical protein